VLSVGRLLFRTLIRRSPPDVFQESRPPPCTMFANSIQCFYASPVQQETGCVFTTRDCVFRLVFVFPSSLFPDAIGDFFRILSKLFLISLVTNDEWEPRYCPFLFVGDQRYFRQPASLTLVTRKNASPIIDCRYHFPRTIFLNFDSSSTFPCRQGVTLKTLVVLP